ncbi:cation channel sperm-associated protein 4-like [Lytechinus pictus]|uniref:cation channel sperm-associated protein 4-like n=1 Tax=Lytechinus pictus TaxID=7653 RepID=UPI0030B9DE49
MKGDETGNLTGDEKEVETLQSPMAMGWVRRASKQVESAGVAFRKIGLKKKLANKLGSKKKTETDETPRLFTFDPNAIERGADFCDLFETDEVEEDFNDVVELDDERVEEVVSQELVGKLVDSMWFRGFILGVIVTNAILIGVQTSQELSQKYAWLFFIFDYTVLSIFVCELILKWYNGFTIYWKIGWNILDFFIIVILLLGPTLKFLGSSRILRILRVLRAFRSLRSVSALAGLSVVVQTIFQSIPDMSNIAFLLLILMVVFSVVGVYLFGDEFPAHFGNLQTAMFTLFICVTQDGWMGIFDRFKKSNHYMMGAIYFILAITIGAFVFANLVVAVVVTNLDKAVKEVKQENKMREDVLTTRNVQKEDEPDVDKEVPVTSVGEVLEKTDLSTQKPLHFGDFKFLTTEKFQSYIVLISALEDNLAEYTTIRDDLDKIFRLIWELNEIDDKDGVESNGTCFVLTAFIDSSKCKSFYIKKIQKKGDILSNLLELEQRKLISTRHGSLSGLLKDAARLIPTSKGTTGQPYYSRRFSRDTSKPRSKTDLRGSGTSLKINQDEVSKGTSQSQDRMAPRDGVEERSTASNSDLKSSESTESIQGKGSSKATISHPENIGTPSSNDSENKEEVTSNIAEDKSEES